ncbi:uncharacterized protein [Typha angustifolia]|uniref:uncharacterized protein n=1 Tax=Typha angustifolia TaxID=59011 RepID=UPI003C2E2DE8
MDVASRNEVGLQSDQDRTPEYKEPAKHQPDEGKRYLLSTPETNDSPCNGLYDRPLSCFGCGIGWLCFILGFAFPLLWYLATVLYFGKYYLKDPRERAGLAASAIAALICSVAVLITLLAIAL